MKPKILLVEDDKLQIDIVLDALGNDYEFYIAKSIEDGKRVFSRADIDVLLLDIVLPDDEGYALNLWSNENIDTDVIIIYMTSVDEVEQKLRGFSLGARDYIIKPFDVRELKVRIDMQLDIRRNRDILIEENRELASIIADKSWEVERVKLATFVAVTSLIDRKHGRSESNVYRMRFMVKLIGQELMKDSNYRLSMDKQFMNDLCDACALHDIGMIALPEKILQKPGVLSEDERKQMTKHTIFGKSAIEDAEKLIGPLPFVSIAKECAYSHHERWDGNGYPEGLREEEIPLASRIMAIIDVYEALISDRPHRDAFSHDEAIEIIIGTKGQFDPNVVHAFRQIADEILAFNR